MTDQYTYPAQVATPPSAPGSYMPPLPPLPQAYPPPQPRKGKGGLITAAILGAAAIALSAGGIGGLVGNHIAGGSAAQSSPPAAAPAPTAEQVHAATVDLCTRFAAGYKAMPSPQNSGFDVLPTANYISDALRDNPAADTDVRSAITKSLALLRAHVAVAGGERSQGAIQTPTNWTAAAANDADQRVWDLCRAYGS
ncbi:hypothetical protein [Mycobacterium avium]|uniref:hypothetical protein n=1 Tax=Mycobacterium avium TaxID=1764 RepID=UPI000BAFE14A|nr:hypothetical protein [Mycobacterium avium]MDO2394716.1 hypothetical protein [Mycobacterium avium subsp. hominissuis]PBA68947.1 hypothetical protein CKJ76_25540 [Mycobacterium avium]